MRGKKATSVNGVAFSLPFHITGTTVEFFFIHLPDPFRFIYNAVDRIVNSKDLYPRWESRKSL